MSNLKLRDQQFLLRKAEGLSDKDAALAAGFPESTARIAGKRILGKEKVAEAFQLLMQETVPAEVIATKIREGLEAMETKIATFEGSITDTKSFINWSERREYLELAAKYSGRVTAKGELPDINNFGPTQFIIDL